MSESPPPPRCQVLDHHFFASRSDPAVCAHNVYPMWNPMEPRACGQPESEHDPLLRRGLTGYYRLIDRG